MFVARHGVHFIALTPLSSCLWPVGEFLVSAVDPAYPDPTTTPFTLYGNSGQGQSDGFPQKLLCADSLVRGCAAYSHCFLLTGK